MTTDLPNKTDSFLKGQDLLYQQFNDVNFYIEDETQENFYFQVLINLFPKIKIEKIFPLNGKLNVINEAKSTQTDTKKVYIVDKDFDDILNNIENLPNLFYLRTYSIENYLLEEKAIVELIIEEKPRTTKVNVKNQFDLKRFINEAYLLFKEITEIYVVVQKYFLGVKNVDHNPNRFFIFNPTSSVKQTEFDTYKQSVNGKLKNIDKRFTINAQIRKQKIMVLNINSIPGKYILQFLKSRITSIFSIQMKFDSFSYRLAKNCKFKSLTYLKAEITKFIS